MSNVLKMKHHFLLRVHTKHVAFSSEPQILGRWWMVLHTNSCRTKSCFKVRQLTLLRCVYDSSMNIRSLCDQCSGDKFDVWLEFQRDAGQTSTHCGTCCSKTTQYCVFATKCAKCVNSLRNCWVCFHQQRLENSCWASTSKDFCLKDCICFCLQMIITQKLSTEITNRTRPNRPVCYLMYKYHGVFESFNFEGIRF